MNAKQLNLCLGSYPTVQCLHRFKLENALTVTPQSITDTLSLGLCIFVLYLGFYLNVSLRLENEMNLDLEIAFKLPVI